MNEDKTNRKLIWLLDELIINVVNSTDADIEARKKIRQTFAEIIHTSLKQAKDDPSFIDAYGEYYEILMNI